MSDELTVFEVPSEAQEAAGFDPDKVLRWDEAGGKVVEAKDYDDLLAIHQTTRAILHIYQTTVVRAIAKGHDAVWIGHELERLVRANKKHLS